MFWDDWYQHLEQLPADSPKWDAAEAFIERVRELIQRKQSGLRSQLQDALNDLRRDCAAEIEFFGLTGVQLWSAAQCSRVQQNATSELVRNLHTLLEEDRQTRSILASTAAADREKRAKLESLDRTISDFCEQLRIVFKQEAEPSMTGPDVADEEAKPAAAKPPAVLTEPRTPISIFDLGRPQRPKNLDEATVRELFSPDSMLPTCLDILPRRSSKRATVPSGKRRADDQVKEPDEQVASEVMTTEPPAAPTDSSQPGTPVMAMGVPDLDGTEVEQVSGAETEHLGADEVKHAGIEEAEQAPAGELEQVKVGEVQEAGADKVPIGSGGKIASPPVERPKCDEDESRAPSKAPSVAKDADLQPLLVQMLCADDLRGAYWLARSLEARGRRPTYPSWLIAAVQGAFWEPADDSALAADLLGIITSQQQSCVGLPCQLLSVAASLYPALTEPMCSMGVWLETNLPFPGLHAIVEGVRDFARFGRKLRPEDTGGRQTRDQAKSSLESVVREAIEWLRGAPNRHTKLPRANHMWSHLVRPGGAIHNMLQPVVQDLRTRAQQVSRNAAEWARPEEVLRRLHTFDLDLHGSHIKPIQASPRNQLMGWIDEARNLAAQWCELVERAERLTSGANWIDEQVDSLSRCVTARLTDAAPEMRELATGDPPAQAAAACCVQRALAKIADLFQQDGTRMIEKVPKSPTPFDCLDSARPRGLWGGLRPRLWWLPEIRVDEQGEPLENQLPAIATALELASREQRSLQTMIEDWMEIQDFRFVPAMIEVLQDESTLDEVEQRYRLLLEGSRHSLQAFVERTEVAIEKALSDGVILEVDRSTPQGMLASIAAAETTCFAPAFEKLNAADAYLATKRRERLEYQRSLWHNYLERLQSTPNGGAGARIIEFVERALDRGDTRVVDECVSRLQEAEVQGIQPAIEWFVSPPEPRDMLRDFLDRCANLEQALGDGRGWGQEAIQKTLRAAGVTTHDLPRPRLEEADRALNAWRNLKKADVQAVAGLRPSVLRVLQFLGLEPKNPSSSVALVTSRSGWAHFRAQVSASGLSPVPQFGSFREDDYDVVCLWERPGALTLGARLNEARLGRQPTIVLYLGRLKANQRLNLSRNTMQGERLQFIVVDEVLMTYLAGERDARLPVCFEIALPFAMINPYTPNSAGNVPPEMFVGRSDMVHALLDFGGNGSCLVYGGRQLGKSALLRRVQREFHNPAQGRFAIFEDINLIGDPLAGRPADFVWNCIRDRLKDLDLIPKNVSTERPEQIARRVREMLEHDPRLRVLVLLDEADCFLDQDAAQQFRNVVELKRLMEGSDRRFKIVFAGLHNVQRFQGIPNQPFAHLGTPLQVGPLDPLAARELVKRPLEVMGYRFADDALVLRILSYTNYHPGLIQLFCSKLLENLHKQTPNGLPRYEITADSVHSVYADQSVRRDICDRFNWTLGLDLRYKAIAWTIIAEQYEERDSFSRLYPSRILYERVRSTWPAGFQGLPADRFRGLLDEMCGLGILVRTGDGYRLRSPNLVHLVGTEDEILLLLSELCEKPAPNQVFSADSYREPIDTNAKLYSPFTFAQSRVLAQPAFGVGLIFGSDALGLSSVNEAVKRFIPADLLEETRGDCTFVDAKVREGRALKEWLHSHCECHPKHERLIVAYRATADALVTAEMVEATVSFCNRRQRSQRQWMRVLFIFDPESTWSWTQLPTNRREKLEDACDAVVPLARWDSEGIRLRLSMEQKMEDTAVCERIEEITGGWPILLDEVFRRSVGVDPRPAADDIADELSRQSSLRERFMASLGTQATPIASHVLGFFRYWDSTIGLDLLPEAIKDLSPEERGATEDEFYRAVQFLVRLRVIDDARDALHLQRLVDQAMPQP